MKIIFLCVGLSLCLSGSLYAISDSWKSLRRGKTVVDIGGEVRILTPGTSCQVKNWKWSNTQNREVLSCRCCLIKAALRDSGRFQPESSQIRFCKKKGQCTDQTIEEITQNHFGDGSPSPVDLIKAVIDEAQQTRSVDTLESITDVKKITNLSTEGVFIVLKRLKVLDSNKCYSVKKFDGGGANTLQLFGVYEHTPCGKGGVYNPSEGTKKLVYIVKGLSKAHEETKNLALIRRSFLGLYNVEREDRPTEFPALAMDVKNFKYEDSKKGVHYIAVLVAAPGEPLFDLLQKVVTLQAFERQKQRGIAQNAFESLGRQLGRLHKKYMTEDRGRLTGYSRAIHGDLHTNNVFYDPTTNTTLIDIETMALALNKPRSIEVDLLRLYLYATLHVKAAHNASQGFSRDEWHKDFIRPFLYEYVGAYVWKNDKIDRRRLQQIMGILRSVYLKRLTAGDFVRTGLNSYSRMQRQYLRPILDDIETEYMRKDSYQAPYANT